MLDEAGLVQLSSGHVDREVDRQPVREQEVPALELPDRRVEHPATDAVDETERLGDRDELLGQHRALTRPLPPHQRFEAHELTGAQVDPWLVDEEQLAAAHRVAERILEIVTARDPCTHLGVEQLASTTAVFLGLIQRDVGVSEERAASTSVSDASAIPTLADTNASNPSRSNGSFKVRIRVGDFFRLGDVGKILTEHDELIAAEPGDGVADSDHCSNAFGGLPKKDVARLVTETVVHHLEVVEVEEQHRERATPPADEIDRVLGAVEKER